MFLKMQMQPLHRLVYLTETAESPVYLDTPFQLHFSNLSIVHHIICVSFHVYTCAHLYFPNHADRFLPHIALSGPWCSSMTVALVTQAEGIHPYIQNRKIKWCSFVGNLKYFVMVSLQSDYAQYSLLELFLRCSAVHFLIEYGMSFAVRDIFGCLSPAGDNLRDKPISDSI